MHPQGNLNSVLPSRPSPSPPPKLGYPIPQTNPISPPPNLPVPIPLLPPAASRSDATISVFVPIPAGGSQRLHQSPGPPPLPLPPPWALPALHACPLLRLLNSRVLSPLLPSEGPLEAGGSGSPEAHLAGGHSQNGVHAVFVPLWLCFACRVPGVGWPRRPPTFLCPWALLLFPVLPLSLAPIPAGSGVQCALTRCPVEGFLG